MNPWDLQMLIGEKEWLAKRNGEEVVQERLNPDFGECTD